MKDKVILLYPRDVILATFVGVAFGFMVKDVEDYRGDRVFGVKTNYTVFGLKVGRILSGVFMTTVFVVIPVILDMPPYIILYCSLLGLVAGFLASRKRFFEIPLWITFFLMLIPVSYFYLRRNIRVNFEVRRDNPYSELLGMFSFDRKLALSFLNRYLSTSPCDHMFFNHKLLYLLYYFPDSVENFYQRVKDNCRVNDRTFIIMSAYYFRRGEFSKSLKFAKLTLSSGGVEGLKALEIIYDTLGNVENSLKYSKLAEKYKANSALVHNLFFEK